MKYKKFNILITIFIIVTIVIRFYLVNHNDRDMLVAKYSGQNVEIIGTIIHEPIVKDFNKTFIMSTQIIDGEYVKTNIKVQTDRYIDYEYGQKIKLIGKVSVPIDFKSSGGRVFFYTNFLLKDGIYFEMKKPKIEIIDTEINSQIISSLFKIKQNFLSNIKNVLGEPHAALAGGLVVGEKSALGSDLIDDFRKTGLIHIVVLSGYNITIIADSIRRMLIVFPRNIGICIGGCGIIAFGILVGGGATVVRSCIMAIIASSASLFRKDYNVGRALFIAGALMLIENPLILFYDPSFQLSFLATLGLIFLSPPIETKLRFITEKWGIRRLISSTLATQIFVSPYLLYLMGQLSVIGIISNILVLPIIPITMLSVFLTGFFGFFSHFISEITGYISHILLSYELFIVRFFARIPFAYIEIPKFSFWIVTGFYLSYFVAFMKLPSTFSQFKFTKKSPT